MCNKIVLASVLALACADLPVTVPLPGNKKGSGDECVSWWW